MIHEWFNKQSRLVQIVLLIIPVVNWFTEIGVRWSIFLKKGGLVHLVMAILFTVLGLFLGYLDLIWCLIFNHLILAD